MSNRKNLLHSTTFHFMVASLVILLSIWLIGPHIQLMGHNPLADWLPRIIPSGVIALIWINYILIKIVLNNKQFKSSPTSAILESEINLEKTMTADLKRDFKQVQRACKTPRPWFLLIGPQGSGKTTFLSQLPFTLNSPQQILLSAVKTTQWIDWWIGEQAVFIDPAGKYALAQSDEVPEQMIWRNLINILKKNRRQAPVRGVLLIIDITTLCYTNNPTFNDLIESLIYQLQILKSIQQPLTVDIIITQSDRIIGFSEFFDDLSNQERKQPLGFAITANKGDLAEQVEKKFEEFIKNLSARSLWRLHHEHSLYKRSNIQQFPLQMEKLGQRLKTLTVQLPWNSQLGLDGVYFISNLQNQTPIDLLQSLPITHTFGLQQYQQTLIHHEPQKYFIDELSQIIILNAQNKLNQHPPATHQQQLAYIAAIIIIAGFTLIWHHSYQNNLSVMGNIMATLHIPSQTATTTTPLAWLDQLNTYAQTISLIQDKQDHLQQFSGLNQSQQLLKDMHQRYYHALQHIFLPYLLQNITTVLEQNKHHNEMTLYNALKIYLMLAKHQHVNKEFIRDWFGLYWQQQFPEDMARQHQLTTHLQQLLQLNFASTAGYEVLIDQVQDELRQLPLANRAFLQLQESYSLQAAPILADLPRIDNVDLSAAVVCSFCTTNHFDHVYTQQIPHIVSASHQANWVLATGNKRPLSIPQQQVLIRELRNLYLDYYKQQWTNTLPHIRLIPAQTLAQAQHNINLLKNTSSEFWRLLTIVKDNITLNQFSSNNELLSTDPSIKTLAKFTDPNSELFQQTKYNLEQLSDYLAHINEITEIDKASYAAAVKRFINNDGKDPISILLQQAQQSPPLIQPWLQTIAQGAWHAILVNARQYLNTIWTTAVVPEYQQHISNHYPIFHDVDNNISLTDFTHFFGPRGTLEDFFIAYLQPFINMEQNYWTFKTVDGESLNIPQNALDMLIRASMIQQMFFSDNHTQPLVNFSLIPLRLGDTTGSVTLNLGSQMIQFNQNQRNDQALFWPARDALFATLLFTGTDEHAPSVTLSGPWAFFKLLDHASIHSSKNAREYQVKFQLENYSAEYILIANHLVNPFIPGILNKFRCPEKL